MTFLNPAILWGLLGISIPIIIHIFNLKRTKKIEFSTLMFLKEIQQSKYKKLKLKQLLILLCRIAFIILLVMMFAKPFEKGYLSKAGEKQRSSVLILLDDSFSMQARNSGGNNFEIGKMKIKELLDALDDNDEIFFSAISAINRNDRIFKIENKQAVLDSIQNIKVSDLSRSFYETMYYANSILEQSTNSFKEIYLLTDGQKTFIEQTNSSSVKLAENTKLNIILTGNRSANNISIDTLNITTRIFEKNRYVKIRCTLQNHDNYNITNKTISLNFNNGKVKDEKAIDIPAKTSVDVEFSFKPNVSGFAGGFIELSQNETADDELSPDNKRCFSFFIPDKINLLIVSSTANDAEYVKLALKSSEEAMKDSSGSVPEYYNIREVSENGFGNESLNQNDCIVLINKPNFSKSETDKLKEFLSNGGGILIYPGRNSSFTNYNEELLKQLELPQINGTFGEINSGANIVFTEMDFVHPIFEGMFKNESKENVFRSSPKVKFGFDLSSGNNSHSLIRLSNDKSFLSEMNFGKGKILLYSSSPDKTMSDFPESNLFSPLTVRSILYLANKTQSPEAVTGEDYFIEIISAHDTVRLNNLYKPNESVSVSLSNKNSILNLKKLTTSSSNYAITDKSRVTSIFSASVDKKESQPDLFSPVEIDEILKSQKLEAKVIETNKPVNASVLKFRNGRELWKYFLLGALLFLLAEFIIAKSMMKTKVS